MVTYCIKVFSVLSKLPGNSSSLQRHYYKNLCLRCNGGTSTNICPWFFRAETVHKSKGNIKGNWSKQTCSKQSHLYRDFLANTQKAKIPQQWDFHSSLLFWNLNLPFIIIDIPGFQELFWNRLSLMMNY